MSGAVKVPGTTINLCGRPFVLAALNVAAVKTYREEVKAVFLGGIPDIELVAKMAHASLSRNYDITLEEVEELIDYGNYFDVWEILLNLSGLAVSAGKMAARLKEQMAAAGLQS
ncbi:hypothetical protein QN372_00815 [Undibacterium sp. RTI2.1]|uniref:hypothetical protein n=1 Tax=unclassified Undibacterium TaxID=2630295 RepID=UPI002AB4A42D|nr:MULTISPECIES: hypothetical protein [unclassified Undibacterium]MDY7537678.1 hypothetical protein [Undibacterium sp. 5I1]MEB0029280.1 hypothetical protein [Undibacterium sp. RTI2.1]MEB0115588.1 hypothetical protein [Undibacterium sp. RTI2.2]MEB0256415.1 hypothetical protein [Undibacterium sp. 5I1]